MARRMSTELPGTETLPDTELLPDTGLLPGNVDTTGAGRREAQPGAQDGAAEGGEKKKIESTLKLLLERRREKG